MRRKIATTTSGSITTGNNAIFSVPDPPSGISVAAGALVFKTGMARKCASNKDDHVIHDESSRLNNGSTVPYCKMLAPLDPDLESDISATEPNSWEAFA
ncbi:unnamed protein product [Fusarium graminearum]|nr:unnamed protein product [Fusarium graminearum]